MRALVLIDLQNDYGSFGALPIANVEAIVPTANALQEHFQLIVATQDWHPADHQCFAANHPWRHPGQVIDINGVQQELSVMHCVQNTFGAELMGGLNTSNIAAFFHKGVDATIASNSGFYDRNKKRSTGLKEWLKDKEVDELYILGIDIPETVKRTALEAIELGFNTYIIEDLTDNDLLKDCQKVLVEIEKAGVIRISSSSIINSDR